MAVISALNLAQRIVAEIPQHIFSDSHGNWPELRTIIADIGKEIPVGSLSMEIHPTDKGTKGKEFLWDVCWINPLTNCMELAVESEMADNKAVVADFKRLLHAKSPMKLIIFDRGSTQGPKLLHDLEAELQRYQGHIKGEQYLAFDCYGDTRNLHCYSWTTQRDGATDESLVRLVPVEGTPIAYRIGERPPLTKSINAV